MLGLWEARGRACRGPAGVLITGRATTCYSCRCDRNPDGSQLSLAKKGVGRLMKKRRGYRIGVVRYVSLFYSHDHPPLLVQSRPDTDGPDRTSWTPQV